MTKLAERPPAGFGVRFDHRHTGRWSTRTVMGFTWGNMGARVHFDCPVKYSGMAQFPTDGVSFRRRLHFSEDDCTNRWKHHYRVIPDLTSEPIESGN